MKLIAALIAAIALAGCATVPETSGTPAPRAPVPYRTLGLERVIGRDAAALTALFGPPNADVREGPARKLQFTSGICVLDTYLYAKARGAAPLVTHVDARQPDGRDIDRASCVAALTRRDGGN